MYEKYARNIFWQTLGSPPTNCFRPATERTNFWAKKYMENAFSTEKALFYVAGDFYSLNVT